MVKSKIETYLGFCVRARKIALGADEIEKQKKSVFLIVCDGGISQNTLKTLYKAQEKFACPLLTTEEGALGALLHKPAVKAAAVKDKNLALAILSVANGEPQFKLYSGGTNSTYGKI
ncbi:MAG: hypothetical protein IJX96_04730 [Clostridia bacterium]|nr:hypothetical protein [Clostridia bacterium]